MEEISLDKILIYSGYIVLGVNFILYFKSFAKFGKAFKCLCIFLLISILCQYISDIVHRFFNIKSNLFISHYFFVGQFIFLSSFFKSVLKNNLIKKILYPLTVIILLTLGAQYYNEPKLYHKFNELEILITSIPLMAYSLVFLFQRIESKDKKFIYFNAGFFIYTLCSTLIFFSGNFKAKRETLILLWELHSYLYLAYQILIFTEWYINFRKPKSTNLTRQF